MSRDQDALGGNSKCTLIANVSPAEKNIDETLSTLKFAQRAKLIHNTAIVNEDMFGNPAVMGEEIRRLRLEIAALRGIVTFYYWAYGRKVANKHQMSSCLTI